MWNNLTIYPYGIYVRIGNNIISRAITDKQARVSF